MTTLSSDANKIIEDYNNGVSLNRLTKKYHHDQVGIRKLLVDNNIAIRPPSKMKYELYVNEIISMYNSGLGAYKIAEKLDIGPELIYRCLSAHDINIKTGEDYRTYPINLELMSDLNNEIGAYWFGFLLADGYINKSRPTAIRVNLIDSDHEHLRHLSNDSGVLASPKYSITKLNSKEFRGCYFTIYSKTLADVYLSSGWREFKRGDISKLPENLDIRHFIRGFCDGDGCVTRNKQHLRIGFCSAYGEVLNWIRGHLVAELGVSANFIGKQKIYYVWWAGSPALRIAEYLYTNQSRCLKRKLDRIMPYLVAEEAKKTKSSTLIPDTTTTLNSPIQPYHF
jgi:hypothetical protein